MIPRTGPSAFLVTKHAVREWDEETVVYFVFLAKGQIS